MEDVKVGDRVGAFDSADDKEVLFFGYGVYEGEEVPPKNILTEEAQIARMIQQPIAKIKLDDGTVIYGAECYWAPEEMMKNWIDDRIAEGKEIKTVDVNTLRAKLERAHKMAGH